MATIAAPVSSSVFPAGLIVSASVVGKSTPPRSHALLAQARMQHETMSNAVLGGDVERSQGESGPLDEAPASISPRRGVLREPPPPSPPPQLHTSGGDESPLGKGAARERGGAGVDSLVKHPPPQLQPKNSGSPGEGPPPVPAHRRGYASRYVTSRDGSGESARVSASPPPRRSATAESATAAAWSATSAASRPFAHPVARQPLQRPAHRPSAVAVTDASERGGHGDVTAAGQQRGGRGGGSATRARSSRRRAAPADAPAENTSRLVDGRTWNSSTVVMRVGGHRRRGGDEVAPEPSQPRRPGGVRSASRPAAAGAGYVAEPEPTASALRSGASSSAPEAASAAAAAVTAAEPPSPPVAPIRVWGAGGSRTPGSLSARRLASAAATEPVPLPTPPPPIPPSPEALRAAADAAEAAELASMREEKARLAALLSSARAKVVEAEAEAASIACAVEEQALLNERGEAVADGLGSEVLALTALVAKNGAALDAQAAQLHASLEQRWVLDLAVKKAARRAQAAREAADAAAAAAVLAASQSRAPASPRAAAGGANGAGGVPKLPFALFAQAAGGDGDTDAFSADPDPARARRMRTHAIALADLKRHAEGLSEEISGLKAQLDEAHDSLPSDIAAMERSLRMVTPAGPQHAGTTRKLSVAVKAAQDAVRAGSARAQASLALETRELASLRPALAAARSAVDRLRSDCRSLRTETTAAEAETAALLEQLATLRRCTEGLGDVADFRPVAAAASDSFPAVVPTARPRVF